MTKINSTSRIGVEKHRKLFPGFIPNSLEIGEALRYTVVSNYKHIRLFCGPEVARSAIWRLLYQSMNYPPTFVPGNVE